METKEILLAAADWLENNNWCQKQMCTGNYKKPTSCCMLGVLNLISSGDAEQPYGSWNARDRIWEVMGESIPLWNDKPGRKKEHVIAKLREAANL